MEMIITKLNDKKSSLFLIGNTNEIEECLKVVQASRDESKLLLADVSNSEAVVCECREEWRTQEDENIYCSKCGNKWD